MDRPRRSVQFRHVSLSLVGALLLSAAWAGPALALPYDGTNPVTTICGDGSYQTWTLGFRNAQYPQGKIPGVEVPYPEQGIPTPIYGNGIKIGEVEILHSRKCATVWSRVKNLTSSTRQVKEALVTYTNSNGAGRNEHWYPTVDNVVANGYGWSNQYRDRASFSAIGGIFYAGAWWYAETPRTVAWVQDHANFADNPFGCNHGSSPCWRWPILANGNSVTRYYFSDFNLSQMPKTGGGTIDIRSDITFMFNEFNNVAASNPFFYSSTYPQSNVYLHATSDCGIAADANPVDSNSDNLYDWGEVRFSTCISYTHDSARSLMCHEFDHMFGLDHVWSTTSGGIDNIGSKATCLGMGSDTGPRIDDVSALDDVYSGVVP